MQVTDLDFDNTVYGNSFRGTSTKFTHVYPGGFSTGVEPFVAYFTGGNRLKTLNNNAQVGPTDTAWLLRAHPRATVLCCAYRLPPCTHIRTHTEKRHTGARLSMRVNRTQHSVQSQDGRYVGSRKKTVKNT